MTTTSELVSKLRDAGNNGPGISPEDLIAAADALEGARGLHEDAGGSQGFTSEGYGWIAHACGTCGSHGEYGEPWPCPTRIAIDGAGR